MNTPRVFAAAVLAMACGAASAQDAPRQALKVCQDPNNLPFSNERGEGIENRIAEVFGKALGLPVSYYAFPQRMNFIRNTLRYKLPGQDYPCDVVLGVPAGFEQVSATKPYYRSTYALVYASGRGLDGVTSGEQFLALDRERLARLRIGLYDRSPASAWLAKHGLVDSGVPYPILSPDPDNNPGQMLERDLAGGKLDAAIVWGPIAGFVAQRVKSPKLVVVPLASEPGVKFDYAIAMGVRYGEPEWKRQIEQLIDSHRGEIRQILQSYGVPLLETDAGTR
ncbi:substrate-binding domain-containing protein [Rubrivivax gelatinosus]|uniref:Amino acid ABC transporter substrate-binding protein (PAAT family) n=1 Tax=Rubrivivax gelatinosus TaxID=28068 RepID=A0A4V2SGV0_RUBGE|nr:substrate-binding domain-containing protein [Rubrivivax gelatinosus]MBK1687193.1 ABC transporter substrate-binding protein [Rubrivivax gelatinosus]TCP02598.1 amino acid ABC transporter substrate-binding protein (PAAT family) [Rubrivivax gelatinosus]